MVGETHVFSPRFVNDARVAFNRVASARPAGERARRVNRASACPISRTNPRDCGLSFITVTGFSPLGDEGNNPQNSVTNTYQVLDTATYARGRHLFKFGADLRVVQQNAFRDVESRGRIQFSPFAFTGNALGDLLLGFPLLTAGARVDNPQHLRTESYNFFVNDSLRVTPRLTLNGRPALRVQLAARGRGRPRQRLRLRRRARSSRSARTASRAAATRPTGTTSRRASGWRGRSAKTARRSCARATASTTTSRRSRPARRSTSTALLRLQPLLLAAGRSCRLRSSNPFPAFFPFPLPDSALAIQRDLRTPLHAALER